MSNVAKLDDYRAKEAQEVRKVVDTDDGYTRIANELLEAILSADLTLRQTKVLFAIIRKTYGYNKKMDWVGNAQLSDITGLAETRCSTVKNELIQMNILISKGRLIGINKNISEWNFNITQNSKTFTKTGKESFTKTVKSDLPKRVNTEDNITKDKKDNISSNEDIRQPVKKTKSKNQPVPYQAVMEAYNESVGDKLPNADKLNDKRKRDIKRLLSELKEPTVDAVRAYFETFVGTAGKFYFGDNNSGWAANFDYLLRSGTLTKTREGSL